jgi:hypothetical protein
MFILIRKGGNQDVNIFPGFRSEDDIDCHGKSITEKAREGDRMSQQCMHL